MTQSDRESLRSDDEEREALLFHRALERMANEEEWDEIEARATRDPGVHHRLVALLRDESKLSCFAVSATESVATIEETFVPSENDTRVTRFSQRAGWFAAAATILLWITTSLRDHGSAERATMPLRSSVDDVFHSTNAPTSNRNELVRVFDDGSTTESELSRTLVDAKRSGEGWELLYLRRSFERVRVSELEHTAVDDAGLSRVVPVSFSDPSEWREF